MKKKICFVISSPLTAKAFLVNHIIVLSVIYDVYLVANFETESDLSEIPLKENKNIAIPRNVQLIKDIRALIKLRRYFKEKQFDAVHTITPKAGLLGIIGARLGGVKKRIHIFTGQVWSTKRGMFKSLLIFLDRVIVWNATHILVDGESQRTFLINKNILHKEKSIVLGRGSISGVDTKKFNVNSDVRTQMRSTLGFTNKDVVFIFLGRFKFDKGIIDLVYAFKKILLKNNNVKLLLVGYDEENLEIKIKEIINQENKVTICGPTNNPQSYLQASDVFCLPSYREGFGTSVIEASAVGLPIICSNIYGLQDAIIENETGLYSEVANIESIYNRMLILLRDPILRKELGDKGARYVKQYFSADTLTQEWMSFYKKILK